MSQRERLAIQARQDLRDLLARLDPPALQVLADLLGRLGRLGRLDRQDLRDLLAQLGQRAALEAPAPLAD